jgi:hypothetical protein
MPIQRVLDFLTACLEQLPASFVAAADLIRRMSCVWRLCRRWVYREDVVVAA